MPVGLYSLLQNTKVSLPRLLFFISLACLYVNFNPLKSLNVRDLYTELSWILL